MDNIQQIDEDDYFRMNDVFTIWLINKQKIHFEDLTTKEARKKFKKFIKYWNRNKLESIYYTPQKLTEQHQNSMYSKHKWNFKLSQKDNQELQNLAFGVRKENLNSAQPEETQIKKEIQKGKIYGPQRPDIEQLSKINSDTLNQEGQNVGRIRGPINIQVPKFDETKSSIKGVNQKLEHNQNSHQ